MLRREGNAIIFENTKQLQEHAGWVVPGRLTPAQAVEAGAAMLNDVDRVARARLARTAGEEFVQQDETYYAEQRKIEALRYGAQLIFAACPMEREQFLIEERARRGDDAR